MSLSDGSISCNKNYILYKWKSEFSNLYNRNCNNYDYDLNNQSVLDDILDCEISVEEVLNALLSSKNGKAPGYDEIPVELYKNQTTFYVVKLCYNTNP